MKTRTIIVILFLICSSLQAQTWAEERYKMFSDSLLTPEPMELIGVDRQYDTYLVYSGDVYPYFDFVDTWIVLYTKDSPIWINRDLYIDMWLQEPQKIVYKR